MEVLNEDPAATVLFVARNEALALFVCKWLVASRKAVSRVVERVHVLVAPFEDGPRRARRGHGRAAACWSSTRADEVTKYALIVGTRPTTSWTTPRCARSSPSLLSPN